MGWTDHDRESKTRRLTHGRYRCACRHGAPHLICRSTAKPPLAIGLTAMPCFAARGGPVMSWTINLPLSVRVIEPHPRIDAAARLSWRSNAGRWCTASRGSITRA